VRREITYSGGVFEKEDEGGGKHEEKREPLGERQRDKNKGGGGVPGEKEPNHEKISRKREPGLLSG